MSSKERETPQQQIRRLERELSDERLKNEILNEMVDVMDRDYGAGLRKKYLEGRSVGNNETKEISLSRMCRVLGVSRQSVYQGESRWSKHFERVSQVKELVLSVRMQLPRLGTRKLHYLLRDEFAEKGLKVGRDTLFSYLRSQHLLVRPRKNYTRTTNSKHWLKKHPNLLADRKATRPEEVFVSDITYVKSHQQTHYLSLVTDAFSRKIMGYHLSDDLSAENVVKALKMAAKNRLDNQPLIHHSDRGLQYASAVYQNELRRHGITPSMTDGYDCYQNALAERVNGILKQEFLIVKCNTGKELELLIKQSVDTYNRKRPHLSLQMNTPDAIHQKACAANHTGFLNYN
jgi:transposase InsO family protein